MDMQSIIYDYIEAEHDRGQSLSQIENDLLRWVSIGMGLCEEEEESDE